VAVLILIIGWPKLDRLKHRMHQTSIEEAEDIAIGDEL